MLLATKEYRKLTKRQKDGVVMYNDKHNVVINCTEKFVKYWTQLGFKVIERKPIRLIKR
ncbi:hypothetical protein [Bacillus phage YungSlug]|nr:hypothetical protein [Bacillus phage YungSlug]